MATQDELVTRVMRILDPSGSGQPVQPEDAQIVRDYAPKKLLDLAYRNIIILENSNDIPDENLEWVSMAIANDLSPDFLGTPPDVNVTTYAERMLKLSVVRRHISRHVNTEFF